MRRLTRDQRLLVHQVHPVKLAADVSASVLSNMLLWRHSLVPGLVLRYVVPVLGSALVLRFTDVDRLAAPFAGTYVLQHMPTSMVAVRLVGDTVMTVGAWRHRTDLLTLGATLVVLGWLHGLIVLAPRAASIGKTSPRQEGGFAVTASAPIDTP